MNPKGVRTHVDTKCFPDIIDIILSWCVSFSKFVLNQMDGQQSWAMVVCQCGDTGWFLGLCVEQVGEAFIGGVSMGPPAG